MTIHAYTAQELDAIARQLEVITVNGQRVFTVIVNKAALGRYHAIFVDTGVGTQTLEFRKAQEEASPTT